MSNEDKTVGYKRPPVQYRFQKRQSGNPSGRPKKKPDFLEDAALILSAPVTGNVNGKLVTLPALQAMFRRMCRNALKGDNAALYRVIELMLMLEPEPDRQAEQNSKAGSEAKRKLMQMAGLDPDAIDDRPEEPNPKFEDQKKTGRRHGQGGAQAAQSRGQTSAANAPIRLDFGAQQSVASKARCNGPARCCRQARRRPGLPRCKARGIPRGLKPR